MPATALNTSLADPARTATLLQREVLGPIMQSHGALGSVQPLALPRLVGDHSDKFLVLDAQARRSAVVAISPHEHPRTQLDAATRATAARRVLGPRLGAAVLVPWHVGELHGVSFAVTPYCTPLSEQSAIRKMQSLHLRGHLLQWLFEATMRTQRHPTEVELDVEFLSPLRSLVDDPHHRERLQTAAREALDALETAQWSPRLVLAHNDLWEGNVLRAPEGPFEWSFSIIDWGGARIGGHAIYDLVRAAISFGLSRRALTIQISHHAAALDCTPAQTKHHLVTALAHHAANLGAWPADRFADIAEQCLDRLTESISP